MERRIVGFHQDEQAQWVADLECGHAQHVRHDPPWQVREWVITAEGRVGRLGTTLRCPQCERGTSSPLSRSALLSFLRHHRYAAQASAGPAGNVQAAVVGIAVSDEFEIVFDTLAGSRKARNLDNEPRIAMVIGGFVEGQDETVQYEGVADRPVGQELGEAQELYFRTFPDGRQRLSWPGLIHVRVRPSWLRYSDFRGESPLILEWTSGELAALR